MGVNDPGLHTALYVPHLFSYMIGALFSGVILDQMVNFLRPSAGKAPPRLFDKVIVALLASASVALLALDLWSMYRLAYQYRLDFAYAYHWQRVDFVSILVICVNTAIAQVWFIERCWRVVKRSYLFLLAVSLPWLTAIMTGCAFFTVGMITVGNVKYFKLRSDLLVAYAWAGCAVDLITTGVLCYRVRQLRSINRQSKAGDILVLAFTTGALTSVTALVCGAVYHKFWNRSNVFGPFIFALPRFSTISVLVTIAHRRTLQGRAMGLNRSTVFAAAPVSAYSADEDSLGRPRTTHAVTEQQQQQRADKKLAAEADENKDRRDFARIREWGGQVLRYQQQRRRQPCSCAHGSGAPHTVAALAPYSDRQRQHRSDGRHGIDEKSIATTPGGSSDLTDYTDEVKHAVSAPTSLESGAGLPNGDVREGKIASPPEGRRLGPANNGPVLPEAARRPSDPPESNGSRHGTDERTRSVQRGTYVSEIGSDADLERALASYRYGGNAHDEREEALSRSVGVRPQVIPLEDATAEAAQRSRKMSGIVVTQQVTVRPEE